MTDELTYSMYYRIIFRADFDYLYRIININTIIKSAKHSNGVEVLPSFEPVPKCRRSSKGRYADLIVKSLFADFLLTATKSLKQKLVKGSISSFFFTNMEILIH